jgi:hypothetical protein
MRVIVLDDRIEIAQPVARGARGVGIGEVIEDRLVVDRLGEDPVVLADLVVGLIGLRGLAMAVDEGPQPGRLG